MFHKQLFPTFARVHNFRKRTQAELNHNVRSNGYTKAYVTAKAAMDIPLDSLLIPQIVTEDTLRPNQDMAYLELLEKLQEKGVPVPLRLWATSAGYDLDKALAMLEEDLTIKNRIGQLTGNMGGEGEEGGEEGGEFASAPAPDEASSLPEKWAVSSGARGNIISFPQEFNSNQVDTALEHFKNDPVSRALAKIEPRLLASLDIPENSIIIPYKGSK